MCTTLACAVVSTLFIPASASRKRKIYKPITLARAHLNRCVKDTPESSRGIISFINYTSISFYSSHFIRLNIAVLNNAVTNLRSRDVAFLRRQRKNETVTQGVLRNRSYHELLLSRDEDVGYIVVKK